MLEGGGEFSVSIHRPLTFHSDGSERLPFQKTKSLSLWPGSLYCCSVVPKSALNCAAVSTSIQIVRDSAEVT
jgi:hypothetical protein